MIHAATLSGALILSRDAQVVFPSLLTQKPSRGRDKPKALFIQSGPIRSWLAHPGHGRQAQVFSSSCLCVRLKLSMIWGAGSLLTSSASLYIDGRRLLALFPFLDYESGSIIWFRGLVGFLLYIWIELFSLLAAGSDILVRRPSKGSAFLVIKGLQRCGKGMRRFVAAFWQQGAGGYGIPQHGIDTYDVKVRSIFASQGG